MAPDPGQPLLSRYRVIEPAGSTALWEAVRASDDQATTPPDADVLLKIVRPELAHDEPSRAYVIRELSRVRLLQHPGVVRPSEILLIPEFSSVALIEPMVSGLSQGLLLSKMVEYREKESDPFPLEETRRIGVQLASILGYIHSQLLCHGDLRLESVLLKQDGVKLCDVGLGRALPRGPYLEVVGRSKDGHIIAPEVRTGRPPDARSDIYGLAAIYRHLLTLGDDGAWQAFLKDHPILGLVLQRGMQEDPQLRYSTVESMVADIEAIALTGAPLKKRHAPTPLAMAVAAGRLPVEELDRPVPEPPAEGRRRRDSVEFDGAVLAPLTNSPSARVSVGTLPPRGSGPTPQTGLPIAASGPTGAPNQLESGPTGKSTKTGRKRTQSGQVPAAELPSSASQRKRTLSAEVPVPAAPIAPQPSQRSQGLGSRPTPSTRNAIPAAAPVQPSTGSPTSGRKRLEPTSDIDHLPTRPVARADLDELRRSAGHSAVTDPDIGAQHTRVQVPNPKPDPDTMEYTEEQERLDPADLRSRPPRARVGQPSNALGADDRSDLLTREQLRLSPEDLAAVTPSTKQERKRLTLQSGGLEFVELPPLLPADSAPEAPATAPPPKTIEAQKDPGDRGTPTEPRPYKAPKAQGSPKGATAKKGTPPRTMVLSALVLSTLVGALAAYLVVVLLRATTHHQSDPPKPNPPEPTKVEAKPEAPAVPAPKAPAPPQTPPLEKAPAAPPARPGPVSKCPEGMVEVRARTTYCVDLYEADGQGKAPHTGVSNKEAEDLCKGRGLRLCTESEWETACRGKERASYPYGHDLRLETCNLRGGTLEKAGARTGCVSAVGAFDMAGNVAEWVRGGGLRGGSAQGETDGRCSTRLKVPKAGKDPFIGFRCCL